ncbi:MAG TPA: hypothetical protein VK652_01100 [Steroidobacteraceae bacterium]|nr:hypothetical protein [Steroidobacteraceae bacterium]
MTDAFEAKAREVIDSFVNGELAPRDETGLRGAIAAALREAAAAEREACAAFVFAEAHEFAKADPLSSDQNIACALSEVGAAIRARGAVQQEEAA